MKSYLLTYLKIKHCRLPSPKLLFLGVIVKTVIYFQSFRLLNFDISKNINNGQNKETRRFFAQNNS